MAIPGLPSGNRARVYARIVDQLTTDPTLDAVVKTWTHGLGRDGCKVQPNAATATHIRLTPRLGPVEWYAPDAHLGDLVVEVDILATGAATGGLDMLDVLDLWEAIENALYPIGDPAKVLAFQQSLRDCGSGQGRVVFSQPADLAGVDKDTGNPMASGRMKVDVLRLLNP